MQKNICIYEDSGYSQLYPLTLTRPVFDLRCGIISLREKVIHYFREQQYYLSVRSGLEELCREQSPNCIVNQFPDGDCYFINGRFIFEDDPPEFQENTILTLGNQFIGAFLQALEIKKLRKDKNGLLNFSSFSELHKHEVKGRLINYPWDLVHYNGLEISKDFNLLNKSKHVEGDVYHNATLLAKENIYIGPGAKVYPGVVINAENGPVYVDKNVTIMSNAVLEGPIAIGCGSIIKIGAKIYEGVSIGKHCKVGGEVEESIIHGFSNKQHEGFLGHSYLGEWVNLGADTNNSDLKNNYGSVKVHINGELIDSGSMFVGIFMGDHSKSGINTMFNTGSVVGVMCNVFGAGFTPKNIPSFTWGGIVRSDRYEFSKAIETAKRVMKRRNQELTGSQEKILQTIYDSKS